VPKAAHKTALQTTTAPAPVKPSDSAGREPLLNPDVIDEFAPLLEHKRALDAQLRVLTADGGTFDNLNKQIREHADQHYPATQRLMLHGRLYDIEATPKENEASPDWKALVKDFGIRLVLKFCSITQKAVKQLLVDKQRPESEYEGYFAKERTGARKLTVVAKTSPVTSEKAA
jgi:hypothetical protein